MDLEYTHREDAWPLGGDNYTEDAGSHSETVEPDPKDGTDETQGRESGNDPSRLRYDPIARYYYPPPYPSEQGHGDGV